MKLAAGAFALLLMFVSAVARAEPFELRDGDRVALIGGTFIEREQNDSYLETLLRTRRPDRTITFRNLGWSGDTVFGESRAVYDGTKGLDRLDDVLRELKPTVVFISYGMVESFDGEAGLSRFREGLIALLDRLIAFKARTVLIGPTKHENLGPPMPDPAEHNRAIRLYADVIKDVAARRGHPFVDLFERLGPSAGRHLTDNGIHLTPDGYHRAAATIAGVGYAPLSPTQEKMRQLAIQKNVQFFNQWRPANEPYIFGFRKAEQSRNRVEIPRFTQSIERLEAEITKLCRLIEVTHELKPQ